VDLVDGVVLWYGLGVPVTARPAPARRKASHLPTYMYCTYLRYLPT